MARIKNTRIKPMTGELVYVDHFGRATEQLDTKPDKDPEEDLDIRGRNLGDGFGVYQGTSRGNPTILDFRSFVAGPGIKIEGDKNEIIISSPERSDRPNIGDLEGTLSVPHGGTGVINIPVNHLVVGSGTGPIRTIPLPPQGSSGMVLSYDTDYRWINVSQDSQYDITSTNRTIDIIKSQVGNSTVFNLGVEESRLNIENMRGTLKIHKGGTGITAVERNALLIGGNGGVWQTLPAPRLHGNYILTGNGNVVEWKDNTSLTSFNTESDSPQLIIHPPTIDINNRTLYINFDQTKIDIDATSGVLGINKGGTGLDTIGPADHYLVSDGTKLEYRKVANPGGSGTVTSVGISSANNLISVSNSPITSSGTMQIELMPSRISINDLNGILSVTKGGLGTSHLGSAGQMLVVNSTATGFTYRDVPENESSELPILATVATTGKYDDLIDKPTFSNVATTGDFYDLSNRPTISLVGATGNYSDLIDAPQPGLDEFIIQSSTPILNVDNQTVNKDNNVVNLDIKLDEIDVAELSGVLPVENGGTGLNDIGPANTFLVSDGERYFYKEIIDEDNIGTVTSVDIFTPHPAFNFRGGPITTSGTIELDVYENRLDIGNMIGVLDWDHGGTGLSELGDKGQVLASKGGEEGYEFVTASVEVAKDTVTLSNNAEHVINTLEHELVGYTADLVLRHKSTSDTSWSDWRGSNSLVVEFNSDNIKIKNVSGNQLTVYYSVRR